MQLLAAGDPALRSSDDLAVARAQVGAVAADGPSVRATARRIVAFVDAHPDALLRSCVEGHLTGSALVVELGTGRVLLMHHAKHRRWLQPGGHADGQANLALTALREAGEESGIEGLVVAVPALDLDIHRVAPPGEVPHLHLDVRFLVLAPLGAELRGNHESTDLRWVDPADLAAYGVDESVSRLADAGLAAAGPLGLLGPGAR